MTVFKAEQKIINLLTGIVWWFEVRWNKGAAFTSALFCFYIPLILCFTYSVIDILFDFSPQIQVHILIRLLAIPLLIATTVSIMPFMLTLLFFFEQKQNVFKNTQVTPNPNKENGWLWCCRLLVVSTLVAPLLGLVDHKSSGEVIQLALTSILMDIVMIFAVYTLCAEKISPEEKTRRIEKNLHS